MPKRLITGSMRDILSNYVALLPHDDVVKEFFEKYFKDGYKKSEDDIRNYKKDLPRTVVLTAYNEREVALLRGIEFSKDMSYTQGQLDARMFLLFFQRALDCNPPDIKFGFSYLNDKNKPCGFAMLVDPTNRDNWCIAHITNSTSLDHSVSVLLSNNNLDCNPEEAVDATRENFLRNTDVKSDKIKKLIDYIIDAIMKDDRMVLHRLDYFFKGQGGLITSVDDLFERLRSMPVTAFAPYSLQGHHEMRGEQPSEEDTYKRYLNAGGSFRNALSIFGYFSYNDMDEITKRLKQRARRNGYLSYASKQTLKSLPFDEESPAIPFTYSPEPKQIPEPPARFYIHTIQKILIYCAFPPLLLWEAAQWIVNQLLGRWISFAVLQVQYLDSAEASVTWVPTQDRVMLETYMVSSPVPAGQAHKRLILFPGSGEFVMFPAALQPWADKYQCQVVSFSHRGCGASRGAVRSQDDLVCDGIAQVQRALDDGISAENITLYGYSLGGATATLVAYHFHQKGQEIKLFNDRGFSSISAVVRAYVLNFCFEFQDRFGTAIQSKSKNMLSDGVSMGQLATIVLLGMGWLLASLVTVLGYLISAITFLF